MTHTQAIEILRKGAAVARGGRRFAAGKDDVGRLSGIFDVTDPNAPERYSFSEDDYEATDWKKA